MSRQASHDTGPERALRSALHRRGLRYFVHRRPLPALRREADIVFIRTQVAVFVDGCFWHGCPTHGTRPRRNAQYWSEKISRNRRRDADTDTRLAADGWTPVRVWEHEPPEEAADRIETLIHERIARLAAERERAAAG
ncbi:MAG TPA: very short patch repair endonuclease [Acidimicrobiaceae bacterium]|nr:very short patch repair endonuclease [Acidimicrobiaceae bacterium]